MSAWSMLASAFARGRRVPRSGYKQLTSKVAPRTFYKGKGCAPTGRHTRKGEMERFF
jgi:large subunit ribosomal protein L41